MFEDIVYRNAGNEGGNQNLGRLLSKYIEIKKFEEIYKQDHSHKTRSKLRKSKYIKKALKVIHRELKKRLKPEETYEIWHGLDHLNANVEKKKQNNTKSKIRDEDNPSEFAKKIIERIEAGSENEHTSAYDDYDEYNHKIQSTLAKFTGAFDSSNHWVKSSFLIRTNGLEVLPTIKQENKDYVQRQHIGNLKVLLHLNVLRQNWDLAYKIFCLLIRLPSVDIRAIWPIGIEILIRQQEKLTHEGAERITSKDERFYDWLSSFFTIAYVNAAHLDGPSKVSLAPIWRSGSKSHTPLYIVSSLWNLLSKGKYQTLEQRLGELVLEPPYNSDGVFYFLMVLCNIVEATEIVNRFLKDRTDYIDGVVSRAIDSDGVVISLERLVASIEKNLKMCDTLHFVYSKETIDNQIALLFHLVRADIRAKLIEDEDESEESSADEIADFPEDNELPRYGSRRASNVLDDLESPEFNEEFELNRYPDAQAQKKESTNDMDMDFDFD